MALAFETIEEAFILMGWRCQTGLSVKQFAPKRFASSRHYPQKHGQQTSEEQAMEFQVLHDPQSELKGGKENENTERSLFESESHMPLNPPAGC